MSLCRIDRAGAMEKFNYGGQAVLEGVMMRGRKLVAVAVRNPRGEIVVQAEPRIVIGPRPRLIKAGRLSSLMAKGLDAITRATLGYRIATELSSEVHGSLRSHLPGMWDGLSDAIWRPRGGLHADPSP